jgi:hypothetical protein
MDGICYKFQRVEDVIHVRREQFPSKRTISHEYKKSHTSKTTTSKNGFYGQSLWWLLRKPVTQILPGHPRLSGFSDLFPLMKTNNASSTQLDHINTIDTRTHSKCYYHHSNINLQINTIINTSSTHPHTNTINIHVNTIINTSTQSSTHVNTSTQDINPTTKTHYHNHQPYQLQ